MDRVYIRNSWCMGTVEERKKEKEIKKKCLFKLKVFDIAFEGLYFS